MKKSLIFIYSFVLLLFLNSCESVLEEKVFSELDPNVILNTSEGIDKVLNSAYSSAVLSRGNSSFEMVALSGFSSGECWGIGGTVNAWLMPLSNFTWNSNNNALSNEWNRRYAAIRDANLVLDYIESSSLTAEMKKVKSAEAKFIRAFCYSYLYKNFGGGPMFTSTFDPEIVKSKAADADFRSQVEKDFREAANDLPAVNSDYGRASKGAALGMLAKWYLNNKDWEKAAATAKEVIDLGAYALFPDYRGMFQIANEGNKEMIFVHSSVANIAGNQLMALTLPTDYPRLPGQTIYAAHTFFYDSFIDSFEEGDLRKDLFITEYVNTSGETVQGYGVDRSLPYKYELDPAQSSAQNGVDIPELRYSDILLTRAEALNELEGPNEESVSYLKAIRSRVGLSTSSVADFSKESFREAIFKERAWEFFFEGKSREDQIRQGVFVSKALQRDKPAKDYHVLFPFPQREIDANNLLEQNQGY